MCKAIVARKINSAKSEALEALRGGAAIIVVLWHLLLGFAPNLPGVLGGFPASTSWIGRPWYVFVNGDAAVGFFFVLSGFVLTRQSLQTRNADSLAVGAIKRWPRLAGTVGLACLISWVLFPLGLYRFVQAGVVSGSPWLSAFAYSPAGAGIVPNGWAAFREGIFSTFFIGSEDYNSSLWTMRIEFLGSFLCFGLGLMLLRFPRPNAQILLLLISWVACFCANPWLANFPVGVALACIFASRRLNLRVAWLPVLILVSLAAANYTENSFLGRIFLSYMQFPLPATAVYSVGAASALISVECFPMLHAALSGRGARWLGRMSFPVYLLHIPVLCSAGCFAYLFVGGGRYGAVLASVVTLGCTALIAFPLALFDIWWTRLIGRVSRWLISRPIVN